MTRMETFPKNLALVLFVGVLCAGLAVLLRRRYGERPSLVTSLLCSALVLTAGAAAVGPFVMFKSQGLLESTSQQTKLFISLLVFSPALWICARMVSGAASESVARFIHRMNAGTPISYDYGRARVKARGHDIDGAVKEFRHYFEQRPALPEPLFAAAQLLAQHKRYLDAELMLREIRDRFVKRERVWSEATYRLALLLDAEMGNQRAANVLYRELLHRSRKSEQGRLAAERLARDSTPASDIPSGYTGDDAG